MESKLRLMCSYGGHIIPRPHDNTLIYAGGDTRLLSVHRATASSTTALISHLYNSLHLPPHHHFSLKYQLPNLDLDSLISISSDEDLSNMLDEYDRLSSASPPSRIRFFLFPSVAHGGSGFHDLKTEGWFRDTLRSAGVEEREREREESEFGSGSSSSGRVSGGGGGGVVVGEHFKHVKVVLPSRDSLGSDSSIPSPNFSQQAIVYQDASGLPESKAVIANLVDNESYVSDRSPQSDMLTPVQVSGYILSKPLDHPRQVLSPPPPQVISPSPPQVLSPPPPPQQYIHHPAPQTHYVNQYFPSSVPVAPYPTMYQPYVHSQQPVQYHQINKPYPVYMMPVGQAQNPYAIPQTVTHSHSQAPVAPNPVMVASHMVYEGYNCKPAAPAPGYAAKVYGATAMATQPVTGATDDHKHQGLAFPPPNPPSQSVTVTPLETTNYISEYEDPMHAQIYKSQPPGPTLPAELQPITKAETVMLSESLTQLQVENTKQ